MKNERPTIEILTEKEKIAAKTDQVIDVLVRIVPPTIESTGMKRPKLNFGIALDRSGSMDGDKMQRAREAAKYCLDQLLPSDTFSAVIFDDHVDVLFTNQRVEQKELLKRGIQRIEARGGTDLHRGWVETGIQVSEGLDANAINRVLLITDGQANAGETRVDRIVAQARELAGRSISTSTIGIGADFNEDLLMPMAEAGLGNSWHVREPQDMVKIFQTELQGLISQVGHSVTLGITPLPGVTVADVLNDFELDAQGRYVLPNLRAGSPLEIVVRLNVTGAAGGTAANLAEFTVSYTDQATKRNQTISALLKRQIASPNEVAQMPIDPAVAEAVSLLMTARAKKEIIDHMDQGEYAMAASRMDNIMDQVSFAFAAQPSAPLAAERDELRELKSMLTDRQNDGMTRKRMAYSREARRKGK
jgi:Ca-activated chloride channel homolog